MKFLAAVPVMELGPQNMTVLDGKDATLNCRAAGAPIPNVTWIYNGKFKKFHTFQSVIVIINIPLHVFVVFVLPLATNSLQI